jgi:hypothetical protein
VSWISPTPPDGRPWNEPASSNGARSKRSLDAFGRVIVLGYISAFALPPLGLAVGIAVAFRPVGSRRRHAIWIALLSVAGAAVWLVLLATGSLTATNETGY